MIVVEPTGVLHYYLHALYLSGFRALYIPDMCSVTLWS